MGTAIDAHEEARLLDAIKRASELVDGGLMPNAAMLKVARDMQLTPGRIRSVCFAYNTGQQTYQRKHNSSSLGKFAEFPLADAQTVISEMHSAPEKVASVDPDYLLPPSWLERAPRQLVKVAEAESDYQSAPELVLFRRLAESDREKRSAEEQRRQTSALTDKLRAKMASLVDYFHRRGPGQLDFATTEQAVRVYYPKIASNLLDCVYTQLHSGEKRASAEYMKLDGPINLRSEPFTTIDTCLKLTDEIVRCKRAGGEIVAAPPSTVYQDSDVSLLSGSNTSDKEAGLLGAPAISAGLGAFLSRGIGNVPKTKSDLVDDAQLELEDPEHMNELRKIQANTMLTSMMTDPDDPIAGHDPDRVLREYNEVSRLAPRLAEQPAVLRSVLQRRLQGGVQPFEAKELTDIEKTLAQTRGAVPKRDDDESLLG